MRGVNAVGYISDAYGVTEQEIWDDMSELDGRELAAIISEFLGEEYLGGAEALSETFYGLSSTISSLEEQMRSAMGEGYNDVRMQGMEEHIEYLAGESGQQLQQANRMIGEWKGRLENNREQMEREIMAAVMSGDVSLLSVELFDPESAAEQIQRISDLADEYLDIDESAEDAGARAGKILAQAQIEAQMAYNASDGAQLELQMQKTLIQDVTSALVSDKTYWNAGYELGQEMSQGMASTLKEMTWMEHAENGTYTLEHLYDSLGGYHPTGAAYGLAYVPSDDYPVSLHEGEMVLTAAQAREYRYGVYSNALRDNRFFVSASNLDRGYAYGLARVPYDDYPARLHEGEMVLTAAQAREYLSTITNDYRQGDTVSTLTDSRSFLTYSEHFPVPDSQDANSNRQGGGTTVLAPSSTHESSSIHHSNSIEVSQITYDRHPTPLGNGPVSVSPQVENPVSAITNAYRQGDSVNTLTDSRSFLSSTERVDSPGFAYGLTYAPNDDYLARLHQDELVLSPSQGKQYMEDLEFLPVGQPELFTGNVTISGGYSGADSPQRDSAPGFPQVLIQGNQFTIREEADIHKLAVALMEQLKTARLVAK